MSRVAVLSLHTSPLVQPGGGDAGGMNVYVRELVSSLARAGADACVYVRRWADALPEVTEVEPGFRVMHVEAGSVDLPKEELPGIVDEFADRVREHLIAEPVDVIHANYWLSGVAGHRLKHELSLPLVATFHTLARVKAETGDCEPQLRIDAETEVVRCADVMTANSVTEMHQLVSHYGADPQRVEVVAPGVNHAIFSVGSKARARKALGLVDSPVLLFVGRIQPLKGADVAVETLAELANPTAQLLIVGGSSGTNGDSEVRRLEKLIANRGLVNQVEIIEPQPHHQLCTYYRAADVCLVPSRSESFGLVALEAAACGTPVVSTNVGGLRTLVDHGRTGFRIASRDPSDFAAATSEILRSSKLAGEMSKNAALAARSYTWTSTAARLRRVYCDIGARVLVDCS